jgi:hypothetical protein
MTKQQQETKVTLAVAMFETLVALDANDDSDISDAAVASVVHGYMMAWVAMGLGGAEVAPAKPKQRRARRTKANMIRPLAGEFAADKAAAINEKLDMIAANARR